jgi:hypothetical protein
MNNVAVTPLRPGFLVGLSTTVRGNVHYERQDIDPAHREGDAEVSEWNTRKTVADAPEHERAEKARNRCRAIVTRVCSPSGFGYLCPEANKDLLDAAIGEARKVAHDFNVTAQLSRVKVAIMVGKIKSDDVEAVKAINSELTGLMQKMEAGIRTKDTKMVRDAADATKALGQMLEPAAAGRAQVAIETARAAATAIAKAAKAGTAAALTIDEAACRRITDMRLSFLDLDDANEIGTVVPKARAIDLEEAV